jgi:hypothetical protein
MGRGAVNETFAVRQLRVAKGRSGSLAAELRGHLNVRFSPDSDWTAPLRQVTRPATSEHPVGLPMYCGVSHRPMLGVIFCPILQRA